MLDFVKYFQYTDNNQHQFNSPATDGEIAKLELQLDIELPSDYKDFLRFTNGFEGFVDKFYAKFASVDKVYEDTVETCSEFYPWAIYIGTNTNVEMFIIDKRQKPYQFGLLPFIADDNDFIPLGDTFEKFIERLYNGTALGKQ